MGYCSGTSVLRHLVPDGYFVGTINCRLSENAPASRDCATRSITPWGIFALEHSQTIDIGLAFDGADTVISANYTSIPLRCYEGAAPDQKLFYIPDTWRRRLRHIRQTRGVTIVIHTGLYRVIRMLQTRIFCHSPWALHSQKRSSVPESILYHEYMAPAPTRQHGATSVTKINRLKKNNYQYARPLLRRGHQMLQTPILHRGR